MNMLTFIFGTSPRTTIVGYLGAIAMAILPLLQEGKYDWNMLVVAAVIAILSRFVKDANKTGVAVLLALMLPASAFAASSCTAKLVDHGLIELTWVAHTDGSFTSTTCTPVYSIDGWVTHVETDPGGTAPTALYDITLTDKRGYDIGAGLLANRSATATELVDVGGVPVYGPLTLNISNNSVNGATGVVAIMFVPLKGN